MSNERHQVARVDDVGLGMVLEEHAHYAVIEFLAAGHRWTLVVDSDDYEIVQEIFIGYQEIE